MFTRTSALFGEGVKAPFDEAINLFITKDILLRNSRKATSLSKSSEFPKGEGEKDKNCIIM